MNAAAAPGLPPPGARVLVHGLGRFGGGREAVRFLGRRGCRVRVADKSDGVDLQAVRQALRDVPDIDWQLGREDAAVLDDIDVLVANPAVADAHPLLEAARRRGLWITQEVDLFVAAYPGTVVAVTGTNGKSTTSTLLHAALQRSGKDALLGGNIGQSLLAEEANWRAAQIAVLEISSFQLDRLHRERRFAGAVYTRIGKDHVDRHGSLAAYHQAKARMAAAATNFLVHAADDPVAEAYASPATHRLRYANTRPAPHSTGIDDGLVLARLDAGPAQPIVHQGALRLLGAFQLENVMAAATAALQLGADAHAVGLAMAHASPLPFRLQQVAIHDGVRVFDNGVSTEVESTRSALQALTGRVHWVGGGKSKDGDYATVAAAIAPHVASAHLFGAAAVPLGQLLTGQLPCTVHTALADALAAAFAAARPGDAVLFSPAFASFDQYPNFRARALEFHQWLTNRRGDLTAHE
jgi:UDP-N-acetylmuramoylalanine--D-glutamate ligase